MHAVGIIVGSSIGGLVVAALLVCCVCLATCYIKKVRQRKRIWRAMAQVIHLSLGIKTVQMVLLILCYTHLHYLLYSYTCSIYWP